MNLKDLFTESDNLTPDLPKMLAALSVVAGVAMAAVSVYQGKPFDMQIYGVGMGALFAGLGVALGMKKETPNA